MKYDNEITILREYKNLYDKKTLLKRIVHIESGISPDIYRPSENIDFAEKLLSENNKKN